MLRRPPPPAPAPHIAGLRPYQPGKPIAEVQRELGLTDIVKLASNENPLGPSPRAVRAISQALGDVGLYPEGSCPRLRAALARKLGVAGDSLVFGNGSDEIIHLLGLAFLGPGDEVVEGDPTFSRYEAAAMLAQARCTNVPLHDWRCDLEAIRSTITAATRVVFIANPNNPTGSHVARSEIEGLLASLPDRVIVCLDEAYFEFADADDYPDGVDYVRAGANVLVLRTFSKVFGLAGLRIGYGVARPEIIAGLEQVREPFNVNHLAQVGALAALDDAEHLEQSRALVRTGRARLAAALASMGLRPWPSQANFVWVDVRRPCRPVYEALLARGVIVRAGDAFGADTFLRVTIGTTEQNERLIAALQEVMDA
jgi:histidinol-phosphate aminotransferase